MENLTVRIVAGYAGAVKVAVYEKGQQKFIIERDYLEGLIEKMMDEKGYTTELKPQQKYPRVKIND